MRVISALLFIVMMSGSASAAEPPHDCKADPEVVEPCRWFAGAMALTASNGIMLFSRDDETLDHVVRNGSDIPSFDFDYRSTYVGEFEICPYAPVYSDRYLHDEVHVCLNNVRNIEELPWDGPKDRYCQLMPNGRWCKKAKP